MEDIPRIDGLGAPLFRVPDDVQHLHIQPLLHDWSLIVFEGDDVIENEIIKISTSGRLEPFKNILQDLRERGFNPAEYYYDMDNSVPAVYKSFYIIQDGFQNTSWTVQRRNDMRAAVLNMFPFTNEFNTTETRKISNVDILCIHFQVLEEFDLETKGALVLADYSDWLLMTVTDFISTFSIDGLLPGLLPTSGSGLLCPIAKPQNSVLIRTVTPRNVMTGAIQYGCGILRSIHIEDFYVIGNNNRFVITTNICCIYTIVTMVGDVVTSTTQLAPETYESLSLVSNEDIPAESFVNINNTNFSSAAIELVLSTTFVPQQTPFMPVPQLLDMTPADVWAMICEYKDLTIEVAHLRRLFPMFMPEEGLTELHLRLALTVEDNIHLNAAIQSLLRIDANANLNGTVDHLTRVIASNNELMDNLRREIDIREGQEDKLEELRTHIAVRLNMTW